MPTVLAPARIKLQNILFATDLSPIARSAMFYARDLARHYGAALYTVNVLPHEPFVESQKPDPEQARMAAKHELDAMAHSELFKNIRHTELIEEGEVPEAVFNLVRVHDIDLVVIGTGGRKGFGKLLLGSIAEEIFRTAECPVLTVGPHATRWEIDGHPQHILYATDFGPESVDALPYAISLAEENRARLTLLHVSPEPGMVLPEPEPGTAPIFDRDERVSWTKRQLRSLIPEGAELWHEPEYVVAFGPPAETILTMSSKTFDMIVLGAKRPAALTKHLGAGVAYKVACDAKCPVLTVGARNNV